MVHIINDVVDRFIEQYLANNCGEIERLRERARRQRKLEDLINVKSIKVTVLKLSFGLSAWIRQWTSSSISYNDLTFENQETANRIATINKFCPSLSLSLSAMATSSFALQRYRGRRELELEMEKSKFAVESTVDHEAAVNTLWISCWIAAGQLVWSNGEIV